jgi:hypothetical protein
MTGVRIPRPNDTTRRVIERRFEEIAVAVWGNAGARERRSLRRSVQVAHRRKARPRRTADTPTHARRIRTLRRDAEPRTGRRATASAVAAIEHRFPGGKPASVPETEKGVHPITGTWKVG